MLPKEKWPRLNFRDIMKLSGKTVHSLTLDLSSKVSRDDVEEIQTLKRCLDQMAPLIMRCNPAWVMSVGASDLKRKGFRDWSDQRKMLVYFILQFIGS